MRFTKSSLKQIAASEGERLRHENTRLLAAMRIAADRLRGLAKVTHSNAAIDEVADHLFRAINDEQAAPKKDDPPDGWMPDGSWAPGG